MTYRELLEKMTRFATDNPSSAALDRQVIVRVDVDDELHVGGLQSADVDCGCTDEHTLVLDAEQAQAQGSSTSSLDEMLVSLQEKPDGISPIGASEFSQALIDAFRETELPMSNENAVKTGDLLYAVGPTAPIDSKQWDQGWKIYSTCVTNVTTSGWIELRDNRPLLGFPEWTYPEYKVGIKIHRSFEEALRAFAEETRHRRDEATQALERADRELKWVTSQALAQYDRRAGRHGTEVIP